VKTTVLLSLLLTSTAAAQPLARDQGRDGWVLGFDAGGSVLSPLVSGNLRRTVTTHEGVIAGIRAGHWGFVLRVEHTLWRIAEGDDNVTQHALDYAVGLERFHPSGFLRFAVFVGGSTLLKGNSLDDPGDTGIYLDARPIGLYFDLGSHWSVGVDPLHFALIAPVLGGVPLVEVQFRTSVLVECTFD